jgi:aryl-alcohol dehydrogenase-like predicted oxidoreductase
MLNAVLDAGINLIDTSVDYGRSEELIGRYLGHRRDEYFLASKCGCPRVRNDRSASHKSVSPAHRYAQRKPPLATL